MWNIARQMSTLRSNIMCKVCVLGANNGIGHPLALQLKLSKFVTDISVNDIDDTARVFADLSHIDTKSRIVAYSGEKDLIKSLECTNIVFIAAEQNHSPKLKTKETMLVSNAELMINFINANNSDMPFVNIISNPVNALVPVCDEYLKQIGCYNPRKLNGSHSIDAVRAITFLGEIMNCDPAKVTSPVMGGHSLGSITPIVSERKPKFDMTGEVIETRKNHGAAQLSIVHCGESFCNNVCRGIYDEKDVVKKGYVASDVNDLEFFSYYFTMDEQGVKECLKLPPTKEHENKRCQAVKDVKNSIDDAKKFVKKYMEEQKN